MQEKTTRVSSREQAERVKSLLLHIRGRHLLYWDYQFHRSLIQKHPHRHGQINVSPTICIPRGPANRTHNNNCHAETQRAQDTCPWVNRQQLADPGGELKFLNGSSSLGVGRVRDRGRVTDTGQAYTVERPSARRRTPSAVGIPNPSQRKLTSGNDLK